MSIEQFLAMAASPEVSTLYLFLIAFLTGILVSFTPCVYPMIPITAGILRTQASQSILRNALSSFAYVLGIALVYSLLGYVAATSSLLFGQWVASPWVIGCAIVIFLYLSGSMFGWYTLYIPSFLQQRGEVKTQASLLGSFMYGLISGTVASPCLTPALALLLGIVAKQGNPLVGFFTLFFFSLGMGMLLMLVGMFSSSVGMLARAGDWMVFVERAFGFLMLAMCFYIAQPLFSSVVIFSGFAGIMSITTAYYFYNARKSWVAFLFGIISLSITILVIRYLMGIL